MNIMNVEREPISPNARSWWKLMNGMDPHGPPPPPPARPPSQVMVEDIDSVPSKDHSCCSMELKHSNTLLTDDGAEEDPEYFDNTETLHHNDGIDLKSPEQQASLQIAYYHVGPRSSGTQSQASRIKDKMSGIHRKYTPPSPDDQDAFDEIRKDPPEAKSSSSSSKLFRIFDSAVCGGATTSISSPTMQKLENTVDGWGLLGDNKTQSRMDFTTNTAEGHCFEYEDEEDSFFETDYVRRRTGSLKKAQAANNSHDSHTNHQPSEFGNFESIETEVVEGKDGAYEARIYCPSANDNDDDDSIFDQLSQNSSEGDYAYETFHQTDGGDPADVGIEIHRERTYHSVFESIKEESEDECSDLSGDESVEGEQEEGDYHDKHCEEYCGEGEETSLNSNPPVSKLIQATRTRTEISALTENSSSTYNTDTDQETRGCFLTPKLVRKLRSSKAGDLSSALQPIPTASTASSSIDTESDERANRNTSLSAQPSSRKVNNSCNADNSLFAKQLEENSHHSYVAYFERGEMSLSSVRVIEQPMPDSFPALNSEVVVRVDYSTVSLTDCCLRKGTYWGENSDVSPKLPIVPGTSFVGTIVQLTRPAMRAGFRMGDCVTSLVRTGANSRHLLVSKERLVKVPKKALRDLPKLCCLPEVMLGCFQALHVGQKNAARYRPMSLGGKHILVIDGASAYGSSLIELARAAGATSVYVTAKKRNFQSIQDNGGVPLELDPKFWFSILKGRIDMVIGFATDNSSAERINEKHVEVLNKKKGQVVILTPPGGKMNLNLPKTLKIKTELINVFDAWESDPKQAKRDLAHLIELTNEETLNPQIVSTVPLGEVGFAHAEMDGRKHHGFVLCDPWIANAQLQNPNDLESSFALEELELDLD